MRKFFITIVLIMGCSGTSGDYLVIDNDTGTYYHLDGAPLGHKDGPIMGLPGQYDNDYYYFNYGLDNHLVKLKKSHTTVVKE